MCIHDVYAREAAKMFLAYARTCVIIAILLAETTRSGSLSGFDGWPSLVCALAPVLKVECEESLSPIVPSRMSEITPYSW